MCGVEGVAEEGFSAWGAGAEGVQELKMWWVGCVTGPVVSIDD